MSVTAILNLYKRPHVFKQQYDSLINQTVPPDEILVWRNAGSDLSEFDSEILKKCKFSDSNQNWGVFARYAYALNSTSDYICVLDDDTIVENKWIENCLKLQKEEKCILGSIGVRFHDLNYQSYERYGWANPNQEKVEVDIVGHSSVFPRECLGAFWCEAPVPIHSLSGEDVHLSYTSQKYLGLKTYAAPHPIDNPEIWGSKPKEAMEYGTENHAISINCHGSHFGANLQHYARKGFKFFYAEK